MPVHAGLDDGLFGDAASLLIVQVGPGNKNLEREAILPIGGCFYRPACCLLPERLMGRSGEKPPCLHIRADERNDTVDSGDVEIVGLEEVQIAQDTPKALGGCLGC